jgi:hypothetical protein
VDINSLLIAGLVVLGLIFLLQIIRKNRAHKTWWESLDEKLKDEEEKVKEIAEKLRKEKHR